MVRKPLSAPCRLLLLYGLMLSGTALAAKTDIVEFGSSRMIGEVKSLERGKLYFKTDSTDTIAIDWADVTKLVTSQRLRIERRDGHVSLATFGEGAESAYLAVDDGTGIRQEPMSEIVGFEELEEAFWDRLNIKTSAGYSFARSNGVENLDLSASLSYDTENRSRDLSLTTQESDSKDAEKSVRRTAQYQTLRFSESVYFTGWQGSYEDNDALDLEYRVLAAWIVGREFYPLSNQRVRLFGGIDISEERFSGASSDFGSELVLGGLIDWYKFRSPELDLSSSLTVYPSLTDQGRVRSSLDISLRWELIKDLYWELSVYDDYDSDTSADTAEGGSSNDYGITTSLGWSW